MTHFEKTRSHFGFDARLGREILSTLITKLGLKAIKVLVVYPGQNSFYFIDNGLPFTSTFSALTPEYLFFKIGISAVAVIFLKTIPETLSFGLPSNSPTVLHFAWMFDMVTPRTMPYGFSVLPPRLKNCFHGESLTIDPHRP